SGPTRRAPRSLAVALGHIARRLEPPPARLRRQRLVSHRLAARMPGHTARTGRAGTAIGGDGGRSLHQRRAAVARRATHRAAVAELEPAAPLAPARSLDS